MKHIGVLLSERDLLIRYVIYSAPVEVRLTLPAGANGVEELDLESVDVATLVRNFQTATLSGGVVEADFTDCPLKRSRSTGLAGIQSPFANTMPAYTNPSPTAAMSSTQGPTPSHNQRHVDVFASAWQTMPDRNPSMRIPVFAGSSYGAGRGKNVTAESSSGTTKKFPHATLSPNSDDQNDNDASDDAYDPEEDTNGGDVGPVQLIPSCVATQQGECPKPMIFDSAATEWGDLFEPFESSGHPFSSWLYDIALLSCGLLLTAPSELLHAVLVVLRKELNVSEEEHIEAVAAFLASSHPSVSEAKLQNVQLSTPEAMRKFREQLPQEVATALAAAASPTPKFISERLQHSRSVTVRSRHAFLNKTKAGSFGEEKGTYPAAVRALALAGILSLQIDVDSAISSTEEHAHALLLAQFEKSLGIPAEVMGLVKVHAIMIAQRRINDEASGGEARGMSVQGRFLALVSLAMRDEALGDALTVVAHEASAGSNDPLTPFFRYRNYVYESVLQMTMVPLLILDSGLMQPFTLQTAARLLEQTCRACCRARIVSNIVDTREIVDPTDSEEVYRYILSEVLSANMYTAGAPLVEDDTLSVNKIFQGIANIHRTSLKSNAFLIPHVQALSVLLLRASYRLLSHVLRRRWESNVSNGTLPDTFTSSIHSLREALETIQGRTKACLAPSYGESPGTEDSGGVKSSSSPNLFGGNLTNVFASSESLSQSPLSPATPSPACVRIFEDNNRACVEECFGWLMPLFSMRLEKAAMEMLVREQEMAKRLCSDGGNLHSASAGVSDIFVLFRQLFDPLPSAVVPRPGDLYVQFTSRLLNQINTIAVKVCEPLCISQLQRSLIAKLPSPLRPTEAAGFIKTWKLSILRMDALATGALGNVSESSMIQRLNTIKTIYTETIRFLGEIKEAYQGVRDFTGCPELTAFGVFEEQVLSDQSPILTAIRDLCDCLAIRQIKALYSTKRADGDGNVPGGFAYLYVTDMKHYRNNKRAGVVLKRLYEKEQCNMSDIIDALDVTLSELLPHISDTKCRNIIISSCHRYFVATVAELLLNGGDSRFFEPAHAKLILADIDEVNEYFASTAPKETMVMDAGAEELGLMLRRVVADVFSKETMALLTGNPNYEDCPEISGGTPMSKMILRHVLAHRKDREAKRFVEKHPIEE